MNKTVRYRTLSACLAAALHAAADGTAAQSCSFRNNPPVDGVLLFSPALDPSTASTRTATTEVRVQCTGNASLAWSFTGVYGSSPLRMKHGSLPAFIPYTVAANFQQGPVGNQQWVLTATVLGASYVNAPAGTYGDQLTATVLP